MPSPMIQNVLAQYNCWARNAQYFLACTNNYILPQDRPALAALQRIRPALYRQIHFNLIPDPINGNIDAPVCLLLINPGYSPIDVYNYSSINNRAAVINAGLNPSGKATKYRVNFLFNGPMEQQMLNRRRQVLIGSYCMQPGAQFYAFDDSFNTVEVQTLNGGKHPKKLGSYLWYSALLSKVPNAYRNQVMDLEFFPYHTQTFNVKGMINLEKKFPQCRMAHSDLRDKLIDALKNEDRVFIARTRDLYNYLVVDRGVNSSQVCRFKSSGNMVISRGNLDGAQNALAKVFNALHI